MIRTKSNNEATTDTITSENIIPFKQTEIADEIKKISTELGVFYNCNNLLWQNLDSDSWTIEFNVGKNTKQSVLCCISEKVSRKKYLLF